MFCKNCGPEINEGTKFCASCSVATEETVPIQKKPWGRKETVTVEVPKKRQQETSLRYEAEQY